MSDRESLWISSGHVMTDADRNNLRQIRGKPLPETIQFQGVEYRLETLFKRDFLAATGLYQRKGTGDPERIVLKSYHVDPLWKVIPLGWLGRMLCRRELHYGALVQDVPGVAQVLGQWGAAGVVSEYVPGMNLRTFSKKTRPSPTFFEEVTKILSAIHERGIAHNDLSKPENIMVKPDGSPVLIDFQLALGCRSRLPLLGWMGRRLVRYFQGCDRYHLRKQHLWRRPRDFSPEQRVLVLKKSWPVKLHGIFVRKPYRAVRRFLVQRFFQVSHQT